MTPHLPGPPSALAARAVGVVCIALGFVVGIDGLGRADPFWLRTALGLIVTGLVAQAYALYCALRRSSHLKARGLGDESLAAEEKEKERDASRVLRPDPFRDQLIHDDMAGAEGDATGVQRHPHDDGVAAPTVAEHRVPLNGPSGDT